MAAKDGEEKKKRELSMKLDKMEDELDWKQMSKNRVSPVDCEYHGELTKKNTGKPKQKKKKLRHLLTMNNPYLADGLNAPV